MVVVNGLERTLPGGATLADVAAGLGVAPGEPGVAAAVDGDVVPRAAWPGVALTDGARIEVVRAAAGG
jgi:sulfur carrier protein